MDAWPRAAQGAPLDPDSSGLTRTRRLELGSLIDVAFKRTPGLGPVSKRWFLQSSGSTYISGMTMVIGLLVAAFV